MQENAVKEVIKSKLYINIYILLHFRQRSVFSMFKKKIFLFAHFKVFLILCTKRLK